MTDEERLKWIDEASYEDLLRKLRFAPVGDPFFVSGSKVSEHFAARITAMRSADQGEHVRASKAIGWDR